VSRHGDALPLEKDVRNYFPITPRDWGVIRDNWGTAENLKKIVSRFTIIAITKSKKETEKQKKVSGPFFLQKGSWHLFIPLFPYATAGCFRRRQP
jgi:hypothetical protein